MQIYPWEQNMHVLACDLLSLATFYGWLAARFLAGLQHLTHDGIAAGGLSPWRNLHCTRDWTSTFLSMTKLLRYKLYRTMLKSVGSFSRPGGRRKEEGDRSEQDGVKSEENIPIWHIYFAWNIYNYCIKTDAKSKYTYSYDYFHPNVLCACVSVIVYNVRCALHWNR